MANESRDHEAFINQIADLDIELSVNADGVFTVCTNSEPFFCYDAETQEEAQDLVVKTLASYGRKFFNLGDFDVSVKKDAPAEQPIAFEQGRPLARLKPVLDKAA